MSSQLLGDQLHGDCSSLLGTRIRIRGIPALAEIPPLVISAITHPVVVHVFSALIAHGVWHVVERRLRLEGLQESLRRDGGRIDSRPLLNEADRHITREIVTVGAPWIEDAARSALGEVRKLLVENDMALQDPDQAAANIVEAVTNRIKERVSTDVIPSRSG